MGRWLPVLYLWVVLTVSTAGVVAMFRDVSYTVVEESTKYIIGDLQKDSGILSSTGKEERDRVRFIMAAEDEFVKNHFEVDSLTGTLSALKIDREACCAFKEKCMLKFEVKVRPHKIIKVIKVSVEVIDINDNNPTFSRPHLDLHILEEILPTRSFPLPYAVDRDSPSFANPSYRLESSNQLFTLRVSQNEETDIQLKLKERLDREDRDRYNLKIIAEDRGDPRRTGELSVTVIVTDINDNPPLFNQSKYHIRVKESWDRYKPLIQVRANDLDSGKNGEVMYNLTQTSQLRYGKQFRVDETTGKVYLQSRLDYETRREFKIAILAKDNGDNTLSSIVRITIEVLDENDQEPVITFEQTHPHGNTAEVVENAPRNTIVANLKVTDPDSGQGGEFVCSLDQRDFALKTVYEGDFEIRTNTEFDRETRGQYNITVRCHDKGTSPLYSQAVFTVNIMDQNDNGPSFLGEPYVCNISENNYLEMLICRVQAKDTDLGENGQVRYDLGNDHRNILTIDEHDGFIRAKEVFDFEQTSEILFQVVATDMGQPPRSATTSVTLRIIDVNDEPPKFNETRYKFGLSEGLPPGTLVGTINASDGDAAPYNKISYAMDHKTSQPNTFSIDPRSGQIKTKRVLDRETEDSYHMVVIATDTGTPPLSSTATVVVYVKDKNDNRPIIDFPNPYNSTVYVPSGIPVGHHITIIKATDKDTGPSAQMTYSLSPSLEESHFGIESSTGVVFLQSAFDMEKNENIFVGSVIVKDNGVPSLSATANLKIIFDESLPFVPEQQREAPIKPILLSNQNLIILLCVATSACVIILALIIVLFCTKKRFVPPRPATYTGPGGMIPAYPPYLMNTPAKSKRYASDSDDDDQEPDRSAPSSRNSTLNRHRDNFGVVQHQSLAKPNAYVSIERFDHLPVASMM